MNALDMARTAYSSAAAPIRTNQSTEFEIFAQFTGRIKSAAAKGKLGFSELAAALHDNRRLWTTLAADAASSENGLPPMLKAQIVYLAEFTHLHTSKVLSGKATVDPLIDINTTVMRGLRQQGGAL